MIFRASLKFLIIGFSRLALIALLVPCCLIAQTDRPLIVGTEATFPPFEMVDESGEIVGFDIDVINAIAEDQGLEIQIRDMAFDGLIPALTTGQIDLAISAISITDQRRGAVLFSNPYINAGLVIAVRTDEESIQGIEDLVDKVVAVQIGTTGAQKAHDLREEGKVRAIKAFPNTGLAMQDLILGGSDAVINDRPVTDVYVGRNPDRVKMLSDELNSDNYGIAVRLGNTELIDKINAGLSAIQADERLDEIEARYFPVGSEGGDVFIGEEADGETDATIVESDVTHFFKVLPTLFSGAGIALLVAFSSEIIGILIGLTVALCRLGGKRWLRLPAVAYVDVIRGTPLLVQVLFLYFGIPALFSSITGEVFAFNPIVAGIIACGLNSGAYLSEIYRSAIKSVDKGQNEAARSLGMSARQSFRHVVLPQAIFRALPPMGNEFINLLKDTSLLSVIAVTEIVRVGQLYAARTYAIFPTYLAIAATYFVLVFIATRIIGLLEKKMGVAHQ